MYSLGGLVVGSSHDPAGEAVCVWIQHCRIYFEKCGDSRDMFRRDATDAPPLLHGLPDHAAVFGDLAVLLRADDVV